jgi:hypothetical protein
MGKVVNESNMQKDLTGMQFSKLRAIMPTDKCIRGSVVWECLCDCGKKYSVTTRSLLNGDKRSCGCVKKNVRHGRSESHYYPRWKAMLYRCYNSKHPYFHHYGGRGIKVCDRWHVINNFYQDMGDPPSKQHTVGRIDNDGDYTPSNCRWETIEQQANNKRTNRFITFRGETKTVSQWAVTYGISHSTLKGRLDRGWDTEKALLMPCIDKYKHKSVSISND